MKGEKFSPGPVLFDRFGNKIKKYTLRRRKVGIK
jgi:hypothetical protein